MYKIVLLCAIMALAYAAPKPGRFHQQYQFQQSSSSYRNNELQRKNEEAGFYAKHGDTETPPKEVSSYMQSEYKKPEDENSQTQISVDDFNVGSSHGLGLHGIHPGGVTFLPSHGSGSHRQYHRQSQSSYESGGNLNFGGQQHEDMVQQLQSGLGKLTFAGQLKDLNQQHEDMWKQQTQNGKFEFGSNQSGLSKLEAESHHHAHMTQQEDMTQQQEDMTQQTQDGFGELEFAGQNEDLTQQTQDGFGKFEFGSHQEDMTQQTQDGFGKLDFGSQHKDTTTNQQEHHIDQAQHGVGKLEIGNQHTSGGTHQQGQSGYRGTSGHFITGGVYQSSSEGNRPSRNKPDANLIKPTISTSSNGGGLLEELDDTTDYSKFHVHGFGKEYLENTEGQQIHRQGATSMQSGSNHWYVQNVGGNRQPGSRDQTVVGGNRQPGSHDQSTFGGNRQPGIRDHTVRGDQQPQSGSNKPDGQDDLMPQKPDNIGAMEIGAQGRQPSTIYRQTSRDHRTTQQSQIGYTNGEGINGQTDLIQQRPGVIVGTMEIGAPGRRPTSTVNHQTSMDHHMTQHSESGYISEAEMGSHHTEQDKLSKPESDGQSGRPIIHIQPFNTHHMTPKSQSGIPTEIDSGRQHPEDLTEPKPGSFDKPELGRRPIIYVYPYNNRQTTQKPQGGSSSQTYYSRQHPDITKPKSDSLDKPEFDGQGRHPTTNVQPSLNRPTTQKPLNVINSGNFDGQQQEDLTQQKQDGFGKLEFAGQTHEDTTDQDDLTQQTQDGFGEFEFGRQHQMTHHSQSGFDKLEFGSQTNGQSSQTSQSGSGKLEFGSQNNDHRTIQTQGSLTRPQQSVTNKPLNGISKPVSGTSKPQIGGQEHMTQQTQKVFGGLVLDDNDHMTQQTQDAFGDQHEDMTQQTQYGFGNQKHDDFTQQTQDGFSGFQFGAHNNKDMTQQTQDEYGKFEFGGQEQMQSGIGKLEIGNQHMTQQSQHNYDKLQSGAQSHGGMTQQKYDNFGKLEIDQHSDKTHMTQDGYDQLHLGSQGSTTQRQEVTGMNSQQGSSHRQYGGSGSSSFGASRSFSHQENYHQSHSGSYSHQGSYGGHSQLGASGMHYAYPQVSEGIPDQETDDMKELEDIAQYAQKIEDVSQQVQKMSDLMQEEQNEKMLIGDYNQQSSRDIIEQSKINDEHNMKTVEVEEAPASKPGFWKRLGGSITSTYETAKEKTKTLAEKVKVNLG